MSEIIEKLLGVVGFVVGALLLIWLLDYGSKDHTSAVSLAAREGDAKKVIELVNKGRDVNEKDRYGHTALHWAANSGNLEMARFLMSHGAIVDATNADGDTPLHYAAKECRREMVDFLLAQGASVNAIDSREQTPLHKTAYHGYVSHQEDDGSADIAEMLIKNGATTNLKDRKAKTPLRWSLYRSDPSGKRITALLESVGAMADNPDADGVLHPVYLGNDSEERTKSFDFIETDAQVMFGPFPKTITVSRYVNLGMGRFITRFWGNQQRIVVEKPVLWSTQKETSTLWIDNGLTEEVLVLAPQLSGLEPVRIRPQTIQPIVTVPGILDIEVLNTSNQVVKKTKLNLWGAVPGRNFVLSLGRNAYNVESQYYK